MSEELVPYTAPEETGALIPADPFAAHQRVAVYVDVTDKKILERVGACISLGKPNWEKGAGRCIKCIGVSLWVRPISPAGEEPVRHGIYLAVHAKDGTDYVTAGGGPLLDLGLLSEVYGRPPWPQGVDVTLVIKKTGGGRTLYGLAPGNHAQKG